MAISFDIPERIKQNTQMMEAVATGIMRPEARALDEHEHTRPETFITMTWPVLRDQQKRQLDKWAAQASGEAPEKERKGPGILYLNMVHTYEMLSWGDVGQLLCAPSAMLAGAAIEAVGTPEQKERFLRRFAEGDQPVWGAMAMTEPGAGSDTSAIQTTARLDDTTNEWVINGEKIFITSGKLALDESNGIVVVWATVDRAAGRAGMKPFVVEAGTPGVTVEKVEIKHGIRASDTASIVFKDARVPYDHLLGSSEVRQRDTTRGFKGAMATFDASRPLIAASAMGVGRAALDFVKEQLAEAGIEIPYDTPYHELTAVQRDVLEMEAQLKAAWLLTLRAASMLDHGQQNNLEASMAKAKAGKVVTWVTQKAVEILGPLGYRRDWLAEKWMRDARINDIYEGTGQINTLIVARRILGYSSHELS
jgi:acyl-CoA dehydrogenase